MKQLVVVLALLLSPFVCAQKGLFLSAEQLHERAFPGQDMSWKTLWITKDQRQSIERILNHSFRGIRIRYWGEGSRTVWIFEEIGKELPITIGVTVDAGTIADMAVMEYRESRGGEVRYPFFTDQFKGVALRTESPPKLDGHVDGITGATLSVRAMKKIATLALFCHQLTPFAEHERTPASP
ncbi:FMN-binding protein [Pseudomaricurvus alkylphenolicus]|uniref:FMN-binding protein n=1 Tax=Pseudomaricurvus alkylphenolicus TaxID=1306991 RepID=UPI0014228756|nr:FMN-binding protein [Pseudomaricurvus alkylphenolicus]NIB40207.1 FMN-binding protein [Pseudomaricurvus alkylphenolicus]